MKSFQNKIKNELTNQFNESMDQFNTKNQLMITPLWKKKSFAKALFETKKYNVPTEHLCIIKSNS